VEDSNWPPQSLGPCHAVLNERSGYRVEKITRAYAMRLIKLNATSNLVAIRDFAQDPPDKRMRRCKRTSRVSPQERLQSRM
jgi:hypothetical protein